MGTTSHMYDPHSQSKYATMIQSGRNKLQDTHDNLKIASRLHATHDNASTVAKQYSSFLLPHGPAFDCNIYLPVTRENKFRNREANNS